MRFLRLMNVDKFSAQVRLEDGASGANGFSANTGEPVAVFVQLDGRSISFSSVVQQAQSLPTGSGPRSQLTLLAPRVMHVTERREYVRIGVPSGIDARCTIRLPGLGHVSCGLSDLSFTGMGLEADHMPDVPTHAEIRVAIWLESDGGSPLEGQFTAHLARMSRREQASTVLLGLRWTPLTGPQDRRLSLMIRQLERIQMAKCRLLS
ncbi:flagellar brake protein [Ectothiorhodospira sp. BSL-9]|uniref:flagellar brake protein n=1 Tax=Ectothiorhodospira sp. BSL-9 TaxID=1442136 RepID=UPI0007B42D1B|nr:PilZ domain-containing protein [Ectothiorhodospira sp. BSL-9]ANB03174.1 hypothetical protein ECTOBSL9_2763 [Ectothiorhodospira sp. BSL-9]